ncbi:MAG TPA: hypothetical protein VFQ30_01540 [Ktedonobacteraceae bacterium]|nr:hypothetical protein [Ktedonobacteraceae bacterium]
MSHPELEIPAGHPQGDGPTLREAACKAALLASLVGPSPGEWSTGA